MSSLLMVPALVAANVAGLLLALGVLGWLADGQLTVDKAGCILGGLTLDVIAALALSLRGQDNSKTNVS